MSIFSSEPGVAGTAVTCLSILSFGYVAYAWGMIFTQAFNGAGDTLTPTFINLFAFWIVQIPVASTARDRLFLGRPALRAVPM